MSFFKYSSDLSKYKGPRPIPIFGNVYKISSTKDVVPVIMEYMKEYGPVLRMWFGFRPRLVVSDYKLAEELLKSTTILDKSSTYRFFYPWLGMGLLTSTGDKWKKQRKLLTPTFHYQVLEDFTTVFNKQADILIQKLEKFSNTGQVVDIYPALELFAFDVICETAMGIESNAQKGDSSKYVKSVSEMTRILITRLISPLKGCESLFKLTEDYRKQKEALRIIHDYCTFVIRSREQELISKSQSKKDGMRQTFLDLLLKSRLENEELSIDYIRDEVNTFMLEGLDTSTTGISYTLYCLAKNPDVQEKVVEELRMVFVDNKNADPSLSQLQEMKYLEMVIKETMRLYPPVPLIARELAKNTTFDNVLYRNGMTISLFVYGLHHQKDLYPEPEKFDPERFSYENCLKRPPYAYIPFSGGFRNCIGQRFAMLEMKSAISKILMRFKLLTVPEYKPIVATDFVLRPTNGVLLYLENRDF